MTTIERVALYKLKKKGKYLIHAISRVQMGAGIASEPFVWVDELTPLHEIVKEINYALKQTKTGLPNPTDWKEFENFFLKNIGLKKQSDLYKDSIHVIIVKRDGVIFFTPTKNQGSRGFINVSKENIEISENADIEEVSKALEEALYKCE
jgi:hypothetical protein